MTVPTHDKLFVALIGLVLVLAALSPHAQEYKPIFSEAVLEQADPAARERMAALEKQNRERWQAKQPAGVKGEPSSSTTTPKDEQSRMSGGKLMRYVDADGVTHFSHNPPPGSRASPVEVVTQKPSDADIAERQAALASEQAALEDFAERRRVAERRSAEVEAGLVARQQHRTACRDLFNDIEDYRRGGTVYYDLDERGERVYWSEARLAQEIRKLEARYTGGCGSLDAARESG